MEVAERREIIERAKNFLDTLENQTKDEKVSERLPKVVSKAAREIGYSIINNPKKLTDPKLSEEIEDTILSSFLSGRVIEAARSQEETLKLAKKISQSLATEIDSFKNNFEKAEFFIEAICMIGEIRKKEEKEKYPAKKPIKGTRKK
jgi:hypothetical protein